MSAAALAPKWFLVRVNGDDRDVYAAPVGPSQPGELVETTVLPDPGDVVECAIVRAPDVESARLMARRVARWRAIIR